MIAAATSAACLLSAGVRIAGAADEPKIDRVFPTGGQLGSTVEVRLGGAAGKEPLQFWSEAGQLQAVMSEKGDSATVAIPPHATAGVHWIRFYNAFGTTPVRPFVVGVLPELPETEPNNKLAEAQYSELSSVVFNGVLEKTGDVDTYAVTLKQGQTVVVSMLANRVLNSPMDAVLQLLDSNGTILRQNDDDHELDPQIVHQIAADGRYFVRTFAFPSAPNSSIQFAGAATYIYRLTLTTGSFADHAMPLAVQAGQSTDVTIEGWNSPATAIPVTAELDPQSPITLTANGRLSVGADLSVPVEIDIVTHPSLTEQQLHSENAPELPPPFSVSGTIGSARETDSFLFRGTKGQKLLIRAIARARYSLLDPVVSVHDSDGKELKKQDDQGKDEFDPQLDVTLPADGMFRLSITDRFAHGGSRYFYRLSCEEPRPDFQLSVKDSSFVTGQDKTLAIPVTVSRLNGFDLPLTVTVSGLPEGLSVAPVESLKEGDTSKAVTLSISGSVAAGFSGPIRIHGSAESGPPKSATFSVTGSEFSQSAVWLTVLATETTEPEPAKAEGECFSDQ